MLPSLCTWSPVGIARGNAALAEFGQHSGGINTQMSTDTSEGPAEVVQMDRVIGLLGGQPPTAHRHLVPMQDLADRLPRDAIPGTQLVDRLAALVSCDECLNLIEI